MTLDPEWLKNSFPSFTDFTPLGRGGQKWVYQCRNAKHRKADRNSDLVLKVFHPKSDRDRAMREVEAARGIASPRVPTVLEVGEIASPLGRLIWLTEMRIFGADLRKVLRNDGPLSRPALLRLALHMLEALAAAEAAHIVHRDVKPENILCTNTPSYWLIDFGLARLLDLESLTATSDGGFGTLGYAPVEQCQNRKREIDSRTDLFALGVTLYESATGHHPFRDGAKTQAEVIHRISKVALPAIPSSVDVGEEFRDLVVAMSRPRREQRLESASEAFRWVREICVADGVS